MSPITSAEWIARAVALLRDVEYAGTVWTDFPACPACWRLQEGAELCKPEEHYGPNTHAPDCELAVLLREAERLTHPA